MRFVLPLALIAACTLPDDPRTPPVDDGTSDSGDEHVDYDGPTGFIGSPCEVDTDCGPDGAVCLRDGFPDGLCSLACDRYCPDEDGHPTTFCVAGGQLPEAADALGDGACSSRCDFRVFPDTGCRDDYGCAVTARANEPDTLTYTCVPNAVPDLSDCYYDLAARGVAFEPAIVADRSPETHPGLTCHVEDPLYILGPVHGVDLAYYNGDPTPRQLGACEMAHSLTDTIDDVAPLGVTTLRHYGTYNCRVIAGTDKLSRHAYGDAIDIYGFELDDGSLYTLVDDWEHDTANPQGQGARFLYDAAHRWHDDKLWNIILTPNYDEAHDDHFHVDLTPGSDTLRSRRSWIGVNTTGD